jgi:fumarate reductase subunit C
MQTGNGDALWLTIAGIAVFISWLYPFYRTWKKWVEERSYRAIRAAFIMTLLQVGLFRIVLGSSVRAYPENAFLTALQNSIAPVVSIMLLSGGILLTITWILDDREHKQEPPV